MGPDGECLAGPWALPGITGTGAPMDDDRQRENDRALYRILADPRASRGDLELAYGSLVSYGHPVLFAWVVKGLIFPRCADKGRPVGSTEAERRLLRERPHDVEDVVRDTLAEAVPYFRRCAVEGGPEAWDPDGEAAVGSYFVGCCVLHFPGHFRRWRTRVQGDVATDSYDEDARILDHPATGPTPEDDVVARRSFEDWLTRLTPQDRAIVEKTRDGYRQAEIAAALGLTVRAVQARLNRMRRKRDHRPEEER